MSSQGSLPHPEPVESSDAGGHRPSGPQPDPSGAPRAWRGWRPTTWLLVTGATLVEHAVAFLVWAYISLQHAGVCHEPASVSDLHQGQRALVVATIIATTPWALFLARTRYRVRTALFAGAAVVPVAFGMVQALLSSPAEWTSGWCAF